MSQTLIILSSKGAKGRIVLVLAIIAAIVFAWFAVRWQIGNMLAELTPSNSPGAREIANMAVGLAPSDPLPHWLVAVKEKEEFTPENIENSVKMLEQAVRLSPYDYRWWVELGRSYEQAEKTEQAEKAFKRAIELAPEYTFPRWQAGNFYLRNDRENEAFAEFSLATQKSILYRNQVFSLVWDIYGKDPAKLDHIAAKTPDAQVTLALFYALRDKPQDSLRVWNGLNDEQKEKFKETGKTIALSLHRLRFFKEAFEFARQTGIDADAKPETFMNGSFETALGDDADTLFGWRSFKNQQKMEVAVDSTVKHEGLRSLKVSFKNYVKPTVYNIAQLIQVEPGTRYRVSFWLRTENLRSGGMPRLDIADGKTDQIIAWSEPFPIGSSDWQQVSVDVTVPEGTDGISIQTSRVQCGETCPISGIFWYDDFKISRL